MAAPSTPAGLCATIDTVRIRLSSRLGLAGAGASVLLVAIASALAVWNLPAFRDPQLVGGFAQLQNMGDRIASAGGSLSVRSQPGRGTVVAGSLPVLESASISK